MPPINENAIKDALRHIIDPDLNKDIVTLGFVKNIVIKGSSVSLDIELTTPACPIKAEFQEKAQTAIQKLPGVERVNVTMTGPAPKAPQQKQAMSSALGEVGSIIAVSSCKGGVGKSTVAAHMALEVAHRGFKVGLVDADIYGPSVPTLFNLKDTNVYTNDKKQMIPLEHQSLKLMSFGFLIKDSPAVLRGPIVSQYIQQLMHNTAWGKLDYLFVDMPPGTGDIQLTMTQTAKLNGAVIVTTRQSLSLADVSRGILMFEKVGVPMLGIVENMSYFECDGCRKKHYIFGESKGLTLKERFGLDVLAEIPILPQFTSNLDKYEGNPYISELTDKTMMALGKRSLLGDQIPQASFDQHQVTLTWVDGKTVSVDNRTLRLSCRCAHCMDEITGKIKIQESQIKDDIAPKEVTPLGNYAIGIAWNDGHASGIYPYKNIKELAQVK